MKTSLLTYLMILILGVSCKQPHKKITENIVDQTQILLDSVLKVEKFDSLLVYPSLSLHYKGKPIFRVGQKITEIDSTLSFRTDPNTNNQGLEAIVTDYLTTDENLSIKLGNHASLNGILFFSADRKSKQIFNVSGRWNLDLQKTNMEQVAIDAITSKLFPVLKGKIQLVYNWTYDYESKHQIEHFKITQGEDFKGLEAKLRGRIKVKCIHKKIKLFVNQRDESYKTAIITSRTM